MDTATTRHLHRSSSSPAPSFSSDPECTPTHGTGHRRNDHRRHDRRRARPDSVDPLDNTGPKRFTGHSARHGFVTTTSAGKHAGTAAMAEHGR